MKAKLLALLVLFGPSLLLAQEPRYGGILSNHPVKSTQVLGLELTWLGTRAAGNTSVLVIYQLTCDNGTIIASPDPHASFIALDSGTNSASGSFSGTGVFFPCNGWLNWASMLIYSPNTITPDELMAQIMILNAMPIGWTPAIPAAGGAGTTTTQQSVLTGTIEEVMCNGSLVSGYAVSWPSCIPYQTHPAFSVGSIQNINVANPATATNWQCGATIAAPCPILAGNNQTSVVNVTYTLTTSATAGNRYACIEFLTGGVAGTVVGGPYCSPYAQQPSQVVTYNFSAGVGWATNCSFVGPTQTAVKCPSIMVPLPLYWEANGGIDNFAIDSFVSSEVSATTNGFQTGDQISAINIRVRVKHAND